MNEKEKELLEGLTDGLETISDVVDAQCKQTDKSRRIYTIASFATSIIAIIMLVLSNFFFREVFLGLGIFFLLISVYCSLRSEDEFNNHMAMLAHSDQIRQLHAIGLMVKDIFDLKERVEELEGKTKKEKKDGESRPKSTKRAGRRVHEQGK